METLVKIFGAGKDLDTLQICARGFVIFIAAFIIIRISGRRSFGLRTPLDNIMTILLGAILSRAVVGASPFVPVLLVCLLIAGLHRLLGWLVARYPSFARFVEGDKIVLFTDGKFIGKNLRRVQACREDAMEGVRKGALTHDLEKIDRVYMERNGEISAIRK
jgi:uncharacterized membrane protein YcaP (DUF421 family)